MLLPVGTLVALKVELELPVTEEVWLVVAVVLAELVTDAVRESDSLYRTTLFNTGTP